MSFHFYAYKQTQKDSACDIGPELPKAQLLVVQLSRRMALYYLDVLYLNFVLFMKKPRAYMRFVDEWELPAKLREP